MNVFCASNAPLLLRSISPVRIKSRCVTASEPAGARDLKISFVKSNANNARSPHARHQVERSKQDHVNSPNESVSEFSGALMAQLPNLPDCARELFSTTSEDNKGQVETSSVTEENGSGSLKYRRHRRIRNAPLNLSKHNLLILSMNFSCWRAANKLDSFPIPSCDRLMLGFGVCAHFSCARDGFLEAREQISSFSLAYAPNFNNHRLDIQCNKYLKVYELKVQKE